MLYTRNRAFYIYHDENMDYVQFSIAYYGNKGVLVFLKKMFTLLYLKFILYSFLICKIIFLSY